MNKLASAGLETRNPASWDIRRLWSLWDLMHKLRADVFFKAYEQASTFHQTLHSLAGQNVRVLSRDIAEHINRLTVLSEELTALGMIGAAASINRGLEILKAAPTSNQNGQDVVQLSAPDAGKVQLALSQATSRIPDDLVGQVLLALDPRRVHLYTEPECFGGDVFKKFSPANEDIAEAGKCLALDRGTACVMHLSRVLEVGLETLADSVGIGKKSDWGKYIDGIEIELSKRAKTSGARTPDEQFYAEANINFDNMRRAWRNPTMHPEKSYSPERAEEIFNSIRSFMRHLATRLTAKDLGNRNKW
jgi:hypothetical protein